MLEALGSQQQLPDHEDGPSLAEDVERAGERAHLPVGLRGHRSSRLTYVSTLSTIHFVLHRGNHLSTPSHAVQGETMTKAHAPRGAAVNTTWKDTPTRTISVG